MDMNKMPPAERSAAMRGGMHGWGQVGSAACNVRYALPVAGTSRRRCSCGCMSRATHRGMANGVCLTTACDLAIRRSVKTGNLKPRSNTEVKPTREAGSA